MSVGAVLSISLSTTRGFIGHQQIPCYVHRYRRAHGMCVIVELSGRNYAGLTDPITWERGDFLCDQRGVYESHVWYSGHRIPLVAVCGMRWGCAYALNALQTSEFQERARQLGWVLDMDPLKDTVHYKITHRGAFVWRIITGEELDYRITTDGKEEGWIGSHWHISKWLQMPGMETVVQELEGAAALSTVFLNV